VHGFVKTPIYSSDNDRLFLRIRIRILPLDVCVLVDSTVLVGTFICRYLCGGGVLRKT